MGLVERTGNLTMKDTEEEDYLTDVHAHEVRSTDLQQYSLHQKFPLVNVPYEFHPDRCKANRAVFGQCRFYAMPNSKYCPLHGGMHTHHEDKVSEAMSYRLTKWKARHQELSQEETLKSLNEEVGILRMLIEERLNFCQSTQDLMLHSQALGDLIMKVDKVIGSCNKLELKLATTLDRQGALQLANEFITIIGKHVTDPEVIAKISTDLLASTQTNSQGEETL